MQKYFDNISTGRGPVSGATVTVTTLAGGTPTLYSDNGVTARSSNVLTTDSLGYFEFYAPDGRYNLRITGAGFSTVTRLDILLKDPVDGGFEFMSAAQIADVQGNTALIDVTAPVQAAFNTGNATLFAGTYLVGKLTVGSNTTIVCAGEVILKAKLGLNDDVLVNADPTTGNSNIKIRGTLKIDGNYLNQTTGNGITFSKVTDSEFDHLEGINCRGHGILFSECDRNKIGFARAKSNGKASAGYGIYLYNSNRNRIFASYTEDNCIGIAVEASGAGKTAKRNVIAFAEAINNRADYSQSGAGIHFEESDGGDAGDNVVIYPDCRGSTGVGINLTDVNNIRIIEPVVRDNAKSGITALQCLDFQIIGGECVNNASTEGAGYQAQIRFDDSGLSGCTGRILGMRASGSAVGIKTFTAGCGVVVESSDITGTVYDHEMNGTNDAVDGVGRSGQSLKPQQCAFHAGKTAGTSAAGKLVFDSELFDKNGDYNPATGDFTAPVSGRYAFALNVRSGAATSIQAELRVGATARGNWINTAAAATQAGIAGHVVLELTAGAVVSAYLISGDTYGGAAQTNFSGYLLG